MQPSGLARRGRACGARGGTQRYPHSAARAAFIPGDFDLAHLQATHRYIFGDIYPWAGELRTVRITKGGDLFALPEHIGPYLTSLLADLARETVSTAWASSSS